MDHSDYWGSIEPGWFKDIDGLKEECGGGWDVVFFTGDLVNRGEEKEFNGFSKRLKRLFDHLKKTGSEPCFIAVPGNHDIQRPSSKDASCKGLTKLWDTDEDIRSSIWRKEEDSDYWKTIKTAFGNFTTWWNKAGKDFPIPAGIKPGLLPGEFSLTLEIGTYKIGIVGLNTAFLQLSEGDFKGKLDAHPAQLTALCGADHQDWVNLHDACFLLTHHPMDWLSENGKESFQGVIAPPGRFALHLCGHQHDASMIQIKSGGAQDERIIACGSSLFGMEKYKDWKNDIQVDRRHGYGAGYIDFSGSQPVMRIWPRLCSKKKDKVWGFERDTEFHLEKDGGIKAIPLEKKRKAVPPGVTVPPKEKTNAGKGKQKTPSSSPEIEARVKRSISRLLAGEPLKCFCEELIQLLNEESDEDTHYDIPGLTDILVNKDLLMAISLLERGLRKCIGKITDSVSVKRTWEDCVAVLCWLVLMGVDDEWADETGKKLADKGEELKLFIPAETEAGADIAFKRLKATRVYLYLDEKSMDIKSETGFSSDKYILESGPHPADRASLIKTLLYKYLITVDPQTKKLSDEKLTEELNQTLWNRAQRGEYHYIAVNTSYEDDPLMDNRVYEQLKKDLPDLEIFYLGSEEHGMTAIIGEPKLHAQLREFFRNKPKEDKK
jgi:uncharacterized pyridoxamine 5'-phosphate oxidase family protein